jgi:hypothetical protein
VGATFRRALVGGPTFVGGTRIEDWPLEPIALADGVPFQVATTYILGGVAERPGKYVSHCVENCDWVADRHDPRSAQQRRAALEKLLASRALKGRVREYDREFLVAQIADK